MNAGKFIIILIFAAFLAALSVDNFLFHWGLLGTAGKAIQEILKAISISMITAAVMWIFVGRKSLEDIRFFLETPATLFGRITRDSFPTYVSDFFKKQYGTDTTLVKSVLSIMTHRIFEPLEYWENVDTRVVLPAETDISGYKRIFCSREYTLRSSARTQLRFCCKYSGNRDQQIHETDFDISWTFLPSPGDTRLPESCFKILEVRVNDIPVIVSQVTRNDDPDYVEYVAKPTIPTLEGTKIYYSFEVMQSMQFGFVSMHLKRASHEVTTTLNYAAATEIQNVWPSTAFLNAGHVREIRDIPRSITIKADGWVLPKGATFFSWNSELGKEQASSKK